MKTARTLEIQHLLRGGLHTIRAIAEKYGIKCSRVRAINKEMKHPTNRAAMRELWNVDEVLRKPSTAQGHGWVIL